MNLDTMIFLTGLCVAIPTLLGWIKLRLWERDQK